MKKAFQLPILLFIVFAFSACNSQINKLKKEQFEIVKENVIQVLGDSYHVTRIKAVKEGYTNKDKTEYKVEYSFDLNKTVLIFRHKDIPGYMIFEKKGGNWVCTFNSGNPSGLFNIFQ